MAAREPTKFAHRPNYGLLMDELYCFSRSSLRQRIGEIHGHRYKHGFLQFNVTWIPRSATLWEDYGVVVAERNGLHTYLKRLETHEPHSLSNLLRHHPQLKRFLTLDE